MLFIENIPNIKVNNLDREDYESFFKNEIKRFKKYYDKISKKLEKNFKEKELDNIENIYLKFLEYLLENVNILSIQTNEEDAYTLFERIKDRGLTLSVKDLIKNYLLATIGEDKDIK